MDVSSIQVQLGIMQRREATIEALKSSLATKMAAVEAALLAAQSSNSELTALQDTFTAVTNSQVAMETTLGTLADDVDRVDGRVTSSSSNAGNTRAVVQSLLQQLVHPEATWNEGTGAYTIPEGAVPLYQAIQDQVTSLDSRVSGTPTAASEDLVVRSDGLTPDPNHWSTTAFDWGDTSAVYIAFSSPMAGNFTVATGGGLNGDQVGLKLNSSDWDAQLRMGSESYPYNLMSQAVFVQMTFQSQTLYYSNDYPQILSYGENASDLFSLHMGHSSARAPTLTLKNSSGWTWTHELISPSDYSSFANTKHELLIAMSFDAGTSTLRYRVRAESASSTHAPATTTTQGTRSSTTETFAAALGAYVPRLGGLDEPMQGGAYYHSVQVYKDPLTDAEFDTHFDAYYPAVEVFDSSTGQLRLNFMLDDSTDTVYAVGTPTGDITHDTLTHSLVLPATSSQIVKAPSQPHASYNHTWYIVLSLAQHTATQMLWEHGPLSLKLNQFNSIVLTGDHSTISTMINLSGSGAAYPPIDTPFVVTWYYGNDGMYVLINGTHVWSSPKSHSRGYINEIGTEGRLMGSGTSGRLYDLRMYSTKHDDLQINDTIQAIATELTIDLSTQIAFP